MVKAWIKAGQILLIAPKGIEIVVVIE